MANTFLYPKTVKISAGQQVQRKLVNNQDKLLAAAEKATGGSLDNFSEIKPSWCTNGKTKIEWEPAGHMSTNEGPHVTIREITDSGSWNVVERIFIKG